MVDAANKRTLVDAARTAFVDSTVGAGATATFVTGGESVTITPDAISTVVGTDPAGRFYVPPEEHFDVADFLDMPKLEQIAEQLCVTWGEFRHLHRARLRVLWKKKGGASGGKNTWGKAIKTSGLVKHYADCDFVIWLAADHCRDAAITNYELEALLYHELSHLSYEMDENGEERWSVRGHDVTAFYGELERYGTWTPELRQMRHAYAQLALTDGGSNGQ